MDILPENCRICLKKRIDLVSIYDTHDCTYLPATIYNISGVKILRKLEPCAKICLRCKTAITIAERIILRCQETEEYLQSGSLLKKEPVSEIFLQEESCIPSESATNHNQTNGLATELTTAEIMPSSSLNGDSGYQEANGDSSSRKMKLLCELCNYSTRTAKYLRKHRFNEHGIEDPNIFACKFCPESFAWKAALFRHTENVHHVMPDEKKFPCDECGKAYILKKHLLEHQAQSHAPRRFKCAEPGCQLSFTRAFTLRRHFLSAHDNKTRYRCSDCNIYFKIYDHWKYHNKSVHPQKKNTYII